jgi:hypothetical protein
LWGCLPVRLIRDIFISAIISMAIKPLTFLIIYANLPYINVCGQAGGNFLMLSQAKRRDRLFMATKSERRRYPRHPALFSAKYTVKLESFHDAVSDVSAGGIYIRSRRMIEQGQKISLRFPVFAFDRRPSVAGTVVRSNADGFAVVFDSPIEESISKDVQYPGIPSAQTQSMGIAAAGSS